MRNVTRARALVFALVGALLAIATPGQAEAQNAMITGKVTTDFGTNLEGASVYINDLAINVLTNAQGVYTINIAAARVNGQLVNMRVRALGYRPEVRPVRIVASTQTFNFTMKQDVNRLDEIVVTGSVEGTERAKVPFAVARLSVEDMPVPALDPLRQLAGKVPGVRIAQSSGNPGASAEVMMRGPHSINASGRSQGPLIIVDNIIMNVGSLEELGALDIESVEVVKGAAGASLYGTRAANGVITIKTKRGLTQEGVKFSARSEYGFSDLNSINYGIPENHHLQLDETGTRFCLEGAGNIAACSKTTSWMGEIQRINAVNADTVRTQQNMQWNAPDATTGSLLNVYQANIWPGQYYNSLAQVVTRTPTTIQSLDATGRYAGVRFYVSGSYQNEAGAVKGLDGAQQRRGRVNLDYDVRSDMLVSVSSLFDNGTRDLRVGGSSNGSIFGQALRGAPAGTDYSAKDTLGRAIVRGGGGGLRGSGNGGGTLLYDMENDNIIDKRESRRFLGNITTTYFPADWFTLEGTFGYDTRDREDQYWAVKGYRTFTLSPTINNGQMEIGNRSQQSMNTSITATVRRQLRQDLSGKLQVRGLYDYDHFLEDGAEGNVFLVKDVYRLNNISTDKAITSSQETVKNMGALLGGTAEYKNRYILDATYRYDGSSLFGAGNRWAPFGRISGVWRISEEEFWNYTFMDDFRLRASRGTAGSTPRFSAQYETYSVSATGITLGQAGNSKLKPETTTEMEIGTDFTLFGRLGVEITNANSKTRDQILLVPTPASLGFTEQWQNAGTLSNNTWELGVSLPILNRRDLSWSMRTTWDRTRTHITTLNIPEYFTSAGAGNGNASFFRITARSDTSSNGFKFNRYGNIWGRKFYKGCNSLPTSVQSQCGDGQAFQVNEAGWVVWVGQGNTWKDGITKNLWQTKLPAAQSPWNYALFYGHPIVDRPLRGERGAGLPKTQVLGNVLPDFRMSYSNNLQFKRFNLYALFDGTFGHEIYNQGEGWGLFDFNSATFDMADATVETAKPVGYTWRVGPPEQVGTGGFYDALNPNNYAVEDGSFIKMRELSLSYRVGGVRGVGDWTVGVVGRNLWTITDYTGLDPETNNGAGGQSNSGLINQIDTAGTFPILRTFTFSLSTRF